MEISEKLIIELEKFNKNVAWLRENVDIEVLKKDDDWVDIKAAMTLLNRSRTWLNTRMMATPIEPVNHDWFLFKEVDYNREGNRLVFKKSSILRLKNALTELGRHYEKKIGIAQN